MVRGSFAVTHTILFAIAVLIALWPAPTSAATVRGRVLDARTREPLPCRLYLQAEDGTWLFAKSAAPGGSALPYAVERGKSTEQHVTLPPGEFEIEAPLGELTATAELGKEYHPASQTITVTEQGGTFELLLERWIDMQARGWYSGDTHVHRKLEEMPNLMAAEDLNVALPLTYWVREAYQPAARGGLAGDLEPRVITVGPNRLVWPINTEYELFTVRGKSHTQGAVFVLNHRQPLPQAAPPVVPVAQAARQEGAILDLDKHSWNWSVMIVPTMSVDLFELANNHVWRTEFAFKRWTIEMLPRDWEIETDADGMTEWGWIDFGFKTYYAFLNCGYRMRPTGGTGAGVHPVPLGFGRVYVEVPGEFTYERWIKNLNAGRSFVTTGPMLLVQFNDHPAGSAFHNAHEIRVQGRAASRRPLDRIEIVVNGELARTIRPDNRPLDATQRSPATGDGGYETVLDERISIEHSSWVAVRCFEPQSDGRVRYAHSAPAHYELDGPVRPRRAEVRYFVERMDQEIQRNRGVLAPEEIAEYEQARSAYLKLMPLAR